VNFTVTGKDGVAFDSGICASKTASYTSARTCIHAWSIDSAFALTFHKVQGVSTSNVVLDLNKRPKGLGHVTFASVYVAMTRVTSFGGLSILPPRGIEVNFAHIKKLRPDKDIAIALGWLRRERDGHPHPVRPAAPTAEPTTTSARARGRGRGRGAAPTQHAQAPPPAHTACGRGTGGYSFLHSMSARCARRCRVG